MLPPKLMTSNPPEVTDEPWFKEGDFVIWCGVMGRVLYERKGRLYVGFTNRHICSFYPDGRELDWHAEPSLKLVKENKLAG